MKSLAILLLASVWLGVTSTDNREGFLRVFVSSANLTVKVENAYTYLCVIQSTESVSLPLKDRSKCTTHETSKKIGNTNNPVWNKMFLNLYIPEFRRESRVILEIYDSRSKNNDEQFVGGTSLTIPDLLDHGNNVKDIHLDLKGADNQENKGKINVYFEWTKFPPHL